MKKKERWGMWNTCRGTLILSVVVIAFLVTSERFYAEQYIIAGVSEIQEVNEDNQEIAVLEKNEEMAMTGSVSPITTLDITLPLNGLYFAIDEDRNFQAMTSTIKNNSNCPIDVYVLNISKRSSEPDIVPKDTYTDKEWNNLNKKETLSNIGISINDKELYSVFNNINQNRELALKLGSIKSGFQHTEELELVIDAKYGKNFGKEQLNFQYDLVFEFKVP